MTQTLYQRIAQLEFELIHDKMEDSIFQKKKLEMFLLTRMFCKRGEVTITSHDVSELSVNNLSDRIVGTPV